MFSGFDDNARTVRVADHVLVAYRLPRDCWSKPGPNRQKFLFSLSQSRNVVKGNYLFASNFILVDAKFVPLYMSSSDATRSISVNSEYTKLVCGKTPLGNLQLYRDFWLLWATGSASRLKGRRMCLSTSSVSHCCHHSDYKSTVYNMSGYTCPFFERV